MGFIDTAYVCIHLYYSRQKFQERKKKVIPTVLYSLHTLPM